MTLGDIEDFTVLSVRKRCGVQGKEFLICTLHKKNLISVKNKCSELSKWRSDREGDPLILGLTSNINEGLRNEQKMSKYSKSKM